MKVIKVKKGGIVYLEGKNDKKSYLLKSGTIHLIKNDCFFFERNIISKTRVIKSGDLFGFEEVFANTERLSRAVAQSDCEIVKFEAFELEQVIAKNPKIGKKVLIDLSKRISDLNESIGRNNKESKQIESSLDDIVYYYESTGDENLIEQVNSRIEIA